MYLTGFSFNLFAAETETGNATWLYDFFSKGIQSAYAEYAIALPQPATASAHYYQHVNYSIEYVAAHRSYELRFIHECREDWNVLTHNGSVQPPRQAVYYTDSRIQPWTNSNGLGTYTEKYERKIQNWMVFRELDSLLMMQAKAGNPLPPLNGIFFADELKCLKKQYLKSTESSDEEGICKSFDFDHNGNVSGISRSYLMTFSTRKTATIKNLQDYTMSIRNNNEEVVFVDVLTTGSKNPVMEGLQFKSGDRKCAVFNFEINYLFSKFVPELVADPKQLINEYLLVLQESSAKPFARFEATASN